MSWQIAHARLPIYKKALLMEQDKERKTRLEPATLSLGS